MDLSTKNDAETKTDLMGAHLPDTQHIAALSTEHREYLMNRHGTLDLIPVPSADPADPYNWPDWKKITNLVLVSFHAMMTTFAAAAIIPAFPSIAQDLGGSITKASYLASIQIVVLGVALLFWKPVSNRYGRRPMWLISTLGALLFNVGCALSKSYAAMATCRALGAFFISPPIAIGSGVVTETFFKRQRGRYIGVWTLLVTLGPSTGPFFMGFVIYHTGHYRWVYWILAIINVVQFVAYLFFGSETRYIRGADALPESMSKHGRLTIFRRVDPSPFRASEFVEPVFLFRFSSILIPTVAYTIVFGYVSVFCTVEIPQIFTPKFGFNAQQIGLQFLGIMIGSIIGEQLGGRLSDYWMYRGVASHQPKRAPEYRLWLSYGGFLLAMAGVIVFGVQVQRAPQGHYNVTPIIGIAIASVGNQIVTTVLVTYAIDAHAEHSASIGVFVTLIRQFWGFIGPFWFPLMYEGIGGSASGGLMAGTIFALCWLPIAVLHFWRWRLPKTL